MWTGKENRPPRQAASLFILNISQTGIAAPLKVILQLKD